MSEQLKESQLKWLRSHLRRGDDFIFAAMEKVKDRIKRERLATQPARAP
jgi:hypothetical protein